MNPTGAVEWCSLCNSAPADGKLKVLDTLSNKVLTVPACEPCVLAIPKKDWIDEPKGEHHVKPDNLGVA